MASPQLSCQPEFSRFLASELEWLPHLRSRQSSTPLLLMVLSSYPHVVVVVVFEVRLIDWRSIGGQLQGLRGATTVLGWMRVGGKCTSGCPECMCNGVVVGSPTDFPYQSNLGHNSQNLEMSFSGMLPGHPKDPHSKVGFHCWYIFVLL